MLLDIIATVLFFIPSSIIIIGTANVLNGKEPFKL